MPDEVEFATKPAQATQIIARALDAGTPARWATGDEVYGADPGLRTELVRRRIGYVLAIARDHPISTGIGTRRAGELAGRLAAETGLAAHVGGRRSER
jgi:SRSO17 transposase